MANIAAIDQTGKSTQKLMEFMRLDQLLEWMSDSYGYDMNSLKANTKKDEIRKKNIEQINKLKEILTVNLQQNVTQDL